MKVASPKTCCSGADRAEWERADGTGACSSRVAFGMVQVARGLVGLFVKGWRCSRLRGV